MAENAPKRVALLGIALESNAFAPPTTERDFRERCYVEGESILTDAALPSPTMPQEMVAFIRAMDVTGPWDPVPILMADAQPGGPIDQAFFSAHLDEIVERLRSEAPIDAVFIANHGGMTSTAGPDPDGEMFERVREAVGEQAFVVATLDLHANISERMVARTDLLVSYQTSPHVDNIARGEEAAFALRLMFAGMRPKAAFIRLPLTPASVTLFTHEGPYADMIDFGLRRQREMGGAILNVSVVGGFVFSDTPKNGIAVIVTAREDLAAARRLAREIAELGWRERHRHRKPLTSIDDAIRLASEAAADPSRPAVIFADSGDNPGGGGGGNTTRLLRALVASNAKATLVGSFYDPALAEEAHGRGMGSEFEAVFNREPGDEFAERFAIPARVIGLTDGRFVGRLGIFAGRSMNLGPSCALEIGGSGGILAIVISRRQQTADSMFFEMFGLDIAEARTVAVKSRGHFRAGFAPWFKPEQVYEIDTPGLTSPVLGNFTWTGLPRPVYPLDEDTAWEPPDW